MNARQKKIMVEHYQKLGWTSREISTFGTVDCKAVRPDDSKKSESKKDSKKSK